MVWLVGYISDFPCVIILAGVAGAGKTIVGKLLASDLCWDFYDGNNLHPPDNIRKMASGQPLSDADRWPWLRSVRDVVDQAIAKKAPAVVECSALRNVYRQYLLKNRKKVSLIFLKVPYVVAYERLARRKGHFFKKELAQSQFDVLEEPPSEDSVDATRPPIEVVAEIKRKLCLIKSGGSRR